MDGTGLPHRLLRSRLGRCSAAAASGAAMILTLGAAAAPAAHPDAVTTYNGDLEGVSAVSASDAWAVGGNGAGLSMILHWNGTSWTQAAIPKIPLGSVDAVSAKSADDAWAVGANGSKALVLHWDGTRWTKVATGSANGQLNGVSALSPTDVWSVGMYSKTAGSSSAFVLHWNGSTWSRTPLPQPQGRKGALLGVDAVSANDVWAVGYHVTKNVEKALVLHWNGTRWSVIPSTGGGLNAVTALSATDAWAAGSSGVQSLVLHCNGTGCSRMASPNPGGTSAMSFNDLNSVTALSSTNAWAVGRYGHFNGSTIGNTLVLHWDGKSWTKVASPTVAKSSALYGVAALSASRAWAVGRWATRTVPGGVLILDWNGTSWTRS